VTTAAPPAPEFRVQGLGFRSGGNVTTAAPPALTQILSSKCLTTFTIYSHHIEDF